MNSSDYNKYLAAIKAANDAADKDALRKIQIKPKTLCSGTDRSSPFRTALSPKRF